MSRISFNMDGWNQVISNAIATDGVRRFQRVADACNRQARTDQYMVSVEGGNPLRKRDYRATVITAGPVAMRDNAANNSLLFWMHLAGG